MLLLITLVLLLSILLIWGWSSTVTIPPSKSTTFVGSQGVVKIHAEEGIVTKKYNKKTPYINQESFHCNVRNMLQLRGAPHFPALYDADPRTNTLVMEYCGDRLTPENVPSDWFEQVQEMFRTMKERKVILMDYSLCNFTVKDGRLYLVDLGSCTGRNCSDLTFPEFWGWFRTNRKWRHFLDAIQT